MTRREFMTAAAGSISAVCLGFHGSQRLPTLRRMVRAVPPVTYPGTVVPMGDISMQSKWSG
ncbi:MAG: hypothetical protein ABFE01_14150 [Phycisphaerales bacterium]